MMSKATAAPKVFPVFHECLSCGDLFDRPAHCPRCGTFTEAISTNPAAHVIARRLQLRPPADPIPALHGWVCAAAMMAIAAGTMWALR